MARITFVFIVSSALILAFNGVDSQGIGVKVETSGQIVSKMENKDSFPELTKTVVDEKKQNKNDSKNLTKTVVDEKKDNKTKDLTKTIVDEKKGRRRRQANLPKTTTITYILGKRVNGDRLLAYTSVNQQWTSEQNASQVLAYPKSGAGGLITYVEIIVDQTSNLGSASAPQGGIGERTIKIAIEALKTLQYRSTASIYGQ